MTETPQQPPAEQPPAEQPAPPPAAPAPVAAQPQAPAVRPGGLTALAVLNFVFGGLLLIIYLIAMAGLSALAALAEAAGAEISIGLAWVNLLLATVAAVMLIVSGIGYIKMSKTLGYTMGMVYAIVSIVSSILGVTAGMGFGAGTVIGLAYPVLTLILLNTTFKKCFR